MKQAIHCMLKDADGQLNTLTISKPSQAQTTHCSGSLLTMQEEVIHAIA